MAVYREVSLVALVPGRGGMLHRVRFASPSGAPNIFASRLLYGSLLCLSADEFQSHMVWATVEARDSERLAGTYPEVDVLVAGHEGVALAMEGLAGATWTMAESPTYFEVRHGERRLRRDGVGRRERPCLRVCGHELGGGMC